MKRFISTCLLTLKDPTRLKYSDCSTAAPSQKHLVFFMICGLAPCFIELSDLDHKAET
jgi:hypothetical protein